jgi:hypothetical protein
MAEAEVEARALRGELCSTCFVQLNPPMTRPAQCNECYRRDRPHWCSICNGQFATREELRKHWRNCGGG